MAIAQDEPFGDQGIDRYRFSCQGMLARQYDDDGVAVEKLRAEAAVERRFERTCKGNVDLAGRQPVHLLGRSHLIEGEFDVGVEFTVVADDARKKASRTPQEKPDTKRTYLAEERAVGNFDGAVGSEEGPTRLRQKELAMRRKSGAT
jgi:hypothetical protein